MGDKWGTFQSQQKEISAAGRSSQTDMTHLTGKTKTTSNYNMYNIGYGVA